MIKRKKRPAQKGGPKHLVDGRIKFEKLRVIDPEKNDIGILGLQEALDLARERRLNLVVVSPKTDPPVAKVMDYGKFVYDNDKREKKAKSNQVKVITKEIQIRPKIGEHDLKIKLDRAEKFLDSGNRVKIVMKFRGREIVYMNSGRELLENSIKSLMNSGEIGEALKSEGKNLSIILFPS